MSKQNTRHDLNIKIIYVERIAIFHLQNVPIRSRHKQLVRNFLEK